MDVKEAVALARDYFVKVFADDAISTLTLEEVWFDDVADRWHITFGLQRPIKPNLLNPSGFGPQTYKVVEVSDTDRKVLSIKVRLLEQV